MLCWKPSRNFFFEFAKVTFFSRKFRESWISWLPNIGSAKDKHRVRERRKFRESNIFIREEWPFPDKGILINNHIYICVCVYVHNVINYIKVYIKWSTHFIVGSSLVTRLTAARCGFGIREFARYNQNAWECFWEWFGLLSDQNFTEVVCYPDTSLQSSFS